MKARLIPVLLAAACAFCPSRAAAGAESSAEMAALQREVEELREQLRRLTAAAQEVAELSKRTAEIWARVAEAKRPGARTSDAAPKAASARPTPARKKARPQPAPASVGTVRGKVTVPSGEPIAYVYVENVFAPPVRGKKAVIDQRDKHFVPSWAVVRRGTTIEFPNHDNIYHNVFSRSSGNSFDLGLYNAGEPGKAHRFQTAGAANVYCNIHPKMAASVLVVPNDLFAKVKADGTFAIGNVPSGQRKIVAWSPGSSPTAAWVELSGGGTTEVELVLQRRSGAHLNKVGRAYGSYE